VPRKRMRCFAEGVCIEPALPRATGANEDTALRRGCGASPRMFALSQSCTRRATGAGATLWREGGALACSPAFAAHCANVPARKGHLPKIRAPRPVIGRSKQTNHLNIGLLLGLALMIFCETSAIRDPTSARAGELFS
jgi:hypothetical protein